MFKSIKTILWATLVVSLSLGFASCSSSSSDDEEEVEVKRIPVKIVEDKVDYFVNGEVKESTFIWTYVYDGANRIIRTERQSTQLSTADVVYDENGFISKLGKFPYRYNAEKLMVESLNGENWKPVTNHAVDKEGFYTSHKWNDGSVNTDIYDNNRNWIKSSLVPGVNITPHENTSMSATYSEVYSPFVHAVLPRWTFQYKYLYWLPTFAINAVGRNMPKETEGKTITEQGEDAYVYSFTMVYDILETEGNYPTKIVENHSAIVNLEPDGYKRKTTFTITYQDAN